MSLCSTMAEQRAHVSIASVTLPPRVQGKVKGELVISIDRLQWRHRKAPAQLQLRMEWWGGTDTVVPLQANRAARAAFAITCGPRYMARYFKDMSILVIGVEECPSGRSIGIISVDISHLDASKPIEGSFPCYGSNSQLLGIAEVSMHMRYAGMLSSFELNEHLASTDKMLPLYPVPALLQQQQQEDAGSAHSTADGKENASMSNLQQAATTGSSSSEPASGKQAQPANMQEASGQLAQPLQQPPLQQSSQQQHQQPDQLQTSSRAQATTAAAAPAACDPLLDIVRKAEQLKLAMDQAAQRGIALGLPTSQLAANLPPPSQQRWQPHQQQLNICPANIQAGQMPGAGLPGYARSASFPAWNSPSSRLPAFLPALDAATKNTAQLQRTATGWSVSSAAPLPLLPAPAAQHAAAGSPGITTEGSSCSSSPSPSSSTATDLDDPEELENLVLQELLNTRLKGSPVKQLPSLPKQEEQIQQRGTSRQQQQQLPQQPEQALQAKAPAASASVLQSGANLSKQVRPAGDMGQLGAPSTESAASSLQLLVKLAALVDVSSTAGWPAAAVIAVLKSAGHKQSLDVSQLLQRPGHKAAASLLSQCSTVIPAPQCPAGNLLPTDRPSLAIELWAQQLSDVTGTASPTTAADQAAAGHAAIGSELLGIVRVPLHEWPTEPSVRSSCTTQLDAPLLASGMYPVYDVIHGRQNGHVQLSVNLAQPLQEAEQQQQQLGSPATDSASDAGPQEAAPPGGPAVLAVRHVFDVVCHTARNLPDTQTLVAGGQGTPESRFLMYKFPGEEPLYTQEVACTANPLFAAHAQHTLVLLPGESLADCLCEEGGSGAVDCLNFEVWDKWEDDTDSLIAFGSLPLQQVLQLSQVDHPATSESSGCMRAFLVQLQLAPESAEAVVQPTDNCVLLQVIVSYTASTCYSIDEVDQLAGDSNDLATSTLQDQQVVAVTVPAATDDSHDSMLAVAAHAGAGIETGGKAATVATGQYDGSQAAQDPQGDADKAAGKSAYNTASKSDDGHYEHHHCEWHGGKDSQHVDNQSADQGSKDQYETENSEAAEGTGIQHEPATTAAASASKAMDVPQSDAYAAAYVPRAERAGGSCVSAELCVEIIRACGLQAAVKEAEGWLGGGTALLGKAYKLGPHPYATLSLFPGNGTGSKNVPVSKTPFQAQTFCPHFHYRQVVSLMADVSTLTALAQQDCIVELWHHCPRSQAVAAALSRGQTSTTAMTGQQQVFLGSASCPLQGLLTKPQGVRGWLALRSQLGKPVGAVQIALYFTHIAGVPQDTCPGAACPLSRFPELLQLLPADSAVMLGQLLSCPPPGFHGQLARVSIHMEELLLPGGDELERPKMANYTATYKLPGSQVEASTSAKSPNGNQRTSSLLVHSWRVNWQFCGRHWVAADWGLARALLAYPLLVSVVKHELNRRRHRVSSSNDGVASSNNMQNGSAVPVGTVEVDLSPLLVCQRGTQRSGCRWLSGVFAVVHPMAKNLGNTQLHLRVLLELQPPEAAPDQLIGSPAFWQVEGPLAALPAPVSSLNEQKDEAAKSLGRQQQSERQQMQQNQPQQRQLQQNKPATTTQICQQLQQVADVSSTAGHTAPSRCISAADKQHNTGVLTSCTLAHRDDSRIAGVDITQQVQEVAAAASVAAANDNSSGIATNAAAGQLAPLPTPAGRIRGEVAYAAAPTDIHASSPAAGTAAAAPSSHASSLAAATAALMPVDAHASKPPAAIAATAITGANAAKLEPQELLLVQHQQNAAQMQLVEAATAADQQVAQLHQGVNVKDIRVCIEAALNLQLPAVAAGVLPCLYVRYRWEDATITTPLVPACCGPLGQTASAKWFHCVHLPLVLQENMPADSIKQYSAAANSSRAQAAGSSWLPALLVLQVFCRVLPAHVAQQLPPLYAGITADGALTAAGMAADDDKGSDGCLLGNAALDLSALHMLGTIEGWYNIMDVQQRVLGQVKVSLTPLDQLPAPPRPCSQPANLLQHEPIPVLADAMYSNSAAGLLMTGETSILPTHTFESNFDGDAESALLLTALRADLKELDDISAALVHSWGGSLPSLPAQVVTGATVADRQTLQFVQQARVRKAATTGSHEAASSATDHSSSHPMAAEAAAARAYAMQNILTLSDDEDFIAMGGAVSESEPGTEELMGRVDWSMAQHSDDEGPPGPPAASQYVEQSAQAAQPVMQEDWMFSIMRPAAPFISSIGHPGQLPPGSAAHSSLGMHTSAADAVQPAVHTALAGRAAADGWRHLAELEDSEQAQQQQQQQEHSAHVVVHDPRQLPEQLETRLDELFANFRAAASGGGSMRYAAHQQAAQQHRSTSSSQGPAAAAAARHGGPDNQDDDDLLTAIASNRVPHQMSAAAITRIAFANALPPVQDGFLSEFSDAPRRLAGSVEHTAVAATAVHGSVAQVSAAADVATCINSGSEGIAAATAAATPPTGVDSRSLANAGYAGAAGVDGNESDVSDDTIVPAQRVSYQPRSSSGISFANALPPLQEDFMLTYSDQPHQRLASGLAQAATDDCASPSRGTAAAAVDGERAVIASQVGSRQSSQHAAVQPQQRQSSSSITNSTMAAPAQGHPSAQSSIQPNSRPAAAGFVPVVGYRTSAAGLDEMFSIMRGGGSSSAARPDSASIRHPYM